MSLTLRPLFDLFKVTLASLVTCSFGNYSPTQAEAILDNVHLTKPPNPCRKRLLFSNLKKYHPTHSLAVDAKGKESPFVLLGISDRGRDSEMV